ncbi:hypothetical protein T265_07625 [Opisthorchis viverrini]|uniref:Uncharacterized protein n=1 Tax=Opisthorchis viverrini TaxID=6198 RepID=A0A074ZGL3_OPIVI|nr:hypothetical protein T265_07625 [Opisthorchis viverrini]KER24797.1 hypothetical protein T265_07625 [Opisthorchis viverrini]
MDITYPEVCSLLQFGALSVYRTHTQLNIDEAVLANTDFGWAVELGQPGSIPAVVLPSGGMTARRRKGVTAECFFPSLDKRSGQAEAGFEPRTFRSKVGRSQCSRSQLQHEGWDAARLPKPRQRKSSGRGRVRTTDLPVSAEKNRPAVTSFRCLVARPPEGDTRAEIPSGCPHPDRSNRPYVVEFEPLTYKLLKRLTEAGPVWIFKDCQPMRLKVV